MQRQVWALRIFCLSIVAIVAVALWAFMPYLLVEHRRLEHWKLFGLLSGDLVALLWFGRFAFEHAVLGRPLSPMPINDGRRHFKTVAWVAVAAILIDLAFTFYLMLDERSAYARGSVTDAHVIAIKEKKRSAARWYELDCTFKDQAGTSHKTHLSVQAKKHVLPSQLPIEAIRLLEVPNHAPRMIPIRYDPRHPARAWIDGAGWHNDNGLYWFSLLTLLFQTILTALFLLLLNAYRGSLFPWWWDIYKALPLAVEAFWMLIMGLIDRMMDSLQ